MNKRVLCLLAATLLVTSIGGLAATPPIIDYHQPFHSQVARQGMVVSQEARASQVGQKLLQQGGNAVDAAVGVGLALAVTLPRAGNLGGGGFMLVHMAGKETIALDYREMAPKASHRDMFLVEDGQVDSHASRYSYLSSGVPGTVAGLYHAHKKWGKLPFEKVIAPAIVLAEQGIEVTDSLASALQRRADHLKKNSESRRVYFKPDGEAYQPGERLIQHDLAWSLKQIQQKGADAFYRGLIADKIVADMQRHDGLITHDDLRGYRVVERSPISGDYKGHQVLSMPPPSSGGVHLIQMLNILSGVPLESFGHNSAKSIHWMAESMKYAYADRSQYLGDPDFVDVPVKRLTSMAYATELRKRIDPKKATPSDNIRPGQYLAHESRDTTHFSVIDKEGNAVSNTYTLNFSFGNGHTVAGTGILLNNEMDDFSAKPGVPNAYGLLGAEANAIEPDKRPLSSMSPTLVLKDGKVVMATGSPGGSTIITIVLQQVLNVLTYDLNLATAVASPRIHHQWYPDKVRVEFGVSADTQNILQSMGHNVERTRTMGSVQAILYNNGLFYGFSDPRRPGGAAVGF
jgi:gamma-glutamyltranspeptidase/glutathione hydrolase